jgi:hypothetical protein
VDIAPPSSRRQKTIAKAVHLFDPEAYLSVGEGSTHLGAAGNGNGRVLWLHKTRCNGARFPYRVTGGWYTARINIADASGDTRCKR